MKTEKTAIYKITRPRFRLVMARKRLYGLLDKCRSCPVVWVSGPAGSGKTTLLAAYIEERKEASAWYQVDAGDAEGGTFFYYLGLAAGKKTGRRVNALPVLTPEYAGDVPAFTRFYFDEFFSRLRKPAIIVLDDCHVLSPSPLFPNILKEGMSRIPPGVTVVIVSREGPPPAAARLLAENKIAVLARDELRLSVPEARELLRLYSGTRPPRELIERVREKTRGWAAGLVLASRIIREGGNLSDVLADVPPDGMFDYFAGEVFETLGEETRDFLMRISFATRITPSVARELTGRKAAGPLLADLNRRNCFMEMHRGGAEPAYCFHPLFREFLLSRAHAAYSPAAAGGLKKKAAELMADAGQDEDAAALLIEAGHWAGLAELIQRRAKDLLAQGRNAVLRDWIMSLPEQARERNAGLLYWHGLSLLPFDPAAARLSLDKAFRLFSAGSDAAGVFLSWAAIVESITHELGSLQRLDRWIDAFDGLMRKYGKLPSSEVEDHVASRMFAALAMRKPGHPDFGQWKRRAVSLLERDAHPALQVLTGFYVITYAIWAGEYALAGHVLTRLQTMVASRTAPPLAVITVKQARSWYEWGLGNHTACMQEIREGLALAEKSGVHLWDYSLSIQGVVSLLSRGECAGAEALLAKLAPQLDRVRGFDRFYYYHERAWLSLLQGDLETAFSHQERALSLADDAGIAYGRAQARYGLSQLYHEAGNVPAALKLIGEVRAIGKENNSPVLEFIAGLAEARLLLERAGHGGKQAGERTRGLRALRDALGLGRRKGFTSMVWWWRPQVMAGLLGRALEQDIEVDYVRDLISRHGLAPDERSAALDRWPWRVQIRTLGRFEIRGRDKPLRFSRKTPRKPLEMLKALIAFGGKDVREGRMYEALWPEADDNAAHQALATTLKRLRRLLDDKAAVELSEGRLTLNTQHCWIDAHAFERLADRADAERKKTGDRNAAARAAELAERALALYQGRFLPDDHDQTATEPYRERLRQIYVRTLEQAGAYRQENGDYRDAADYFRKGLEVEELAEEFYQRLMECYRRLGKRAEACAVYGRCRRTLASRLGIEPSDETEAVYALVRSKA